MSTKYVWSCFWKRANQSKLISNMKKFDGNQLPPCSRAERKDQANQVYNWGLAFISISVTARSIAYWLWVDYTVPKVLNQMVRWTTIASIYWCNSGLKRVWSRRYWQRWGILTIKLYVNKIGEKNFLWKVTKFQNLVNWKFRKFVTYTRRKMFSCLKFCYFASSI